MVTGMYIMYVYMYVCMYVCMKECIFTNTTNIDIRAGSDKSMYACIHTHTHMHTHIYTHENIHICADTGIWTRLPHRTNECMHIHIYAYTHIYS
jgi:hypothetical protein